MPADLRPRKDDEFEDLVKVLGDLKFIFKVVLLLVIIVAIFLALNSMTGFFVMDPFNNGLWR